MATVKRTARWFHYLLALMVTGSFSLVGRSAPSWAQEIKRDHSATVFQTEIQRAAQRGSDVDKYALKPSLSTVPYDEDIRTLENSVFQDIELRNKVRLQTLQRIKAIDMNQASPEDLLLYNLEILQQRLDGLESQIKLLDNKLQQK